MIEDNAVDYGERLRVGAIIPSGSLVIEPEFNAMAPPGVAFYATRLELKGSSERELMSMVTGAGPAAKLLADARVDVIMFHCTAVTTFSLEIGEQIRKEIESITGVPAIVTSSAIVSAFKALRVRRVALLTPYVEAVHEREKAFLKGHDIDVVLDKALGLNTNAEMAKLEPEFLSRFVLDNRSPDADAYFLSCTAIRSAGLIRKLEIELDRPVVTSNQAAVWYASSSTGRSAGSLAFGSLFGCPSPA